MFQRIIKENPFATKVTANKDILGQRFFLNFQLEFFLFVHFYQI